MKHRPYALIGGFLAVICLVAVAARHEVLTVTKLITLGASEIRNGATLNVKSNATVTVEAGGTLTLASGATFNGSGGVSGAGTAPISTVTASQPVSTFYDVTLTLADVPIVITDLTGTTNSCGGTKIYDFPLGNLQFLGFQTIDVILNDNAQLLTNYGGDYSFGTTVGTGPDLTGTEIDLMDAKISIDPILTAVSDIQAWDDITESVFDGTSSAKDLYVNVLVDGTDLAANTTGTVSGTVRFQFLNTGLQ